MMCTRFEKRDATAIPPTIVADVPMIAVSRVPNVSMAASILM
jgi:hypothetical protein